MNGLKIISRHAVDWAGHGAIVALMLILFVCTAEAQRGKKPARDKGKNASVSSAKKKKEKAKASDKRSARKETASKKSTASRDKKKRTASERSSGRSRAASTSRSSSSARNSTPRRESTPAVARQRTAPRQPAKAEETPARPKVENGPADLAQQTLLGTGGDRPVRTKRSSPAVAPLTGDQLQVIAAGNQEIEPASLRGYPELERPRGVAQPFYAEGSIGIYTTAALRAGYYGTSWPYDYAIHADAGSTSGFVDNATKLDLGIGARGGYVIGDGYGIFSGGHMGGDVDYGYTRYRRYAIAAAPERTRKGLALGINGQNSYNGTTFELAGGYRNLTLSDSADTKESSIDGSAKVRTQWNRLMVGGEADLRITSLAGTAIGYGGMEAYAKYSTGVISLKAGGAFGVGGNSDGSSVTRLAPLAEINLYPFYGVTLSAGVTGGVAQNTLRGLLDLNPYVIAAPLIHHEAERIGYRASFRFEPWQSFGLRVSGARSSYDDYAYFVPAPNGLFAPVYGDATVTKVTGDTYFEAGRSDMIAVQATFMETSLDSTGSRVPYVPKWDAELMYMKRFSAVPLTLTATARYIGARDSSGAAPMSAVTLVGFKARYAITSHFDATFELNNLINQTYELWPGYRERGFFGAIGIGIKY